MAVPVGPVGVLLLREGLVHGFRVAAPAALAVAAVDLGYAILATAVGRPVGVVLDGHEQLVRGGAATVLVAVAVHGLWTGRSRGEAGNGAVARRAARSTRPTPGRAFARFVGLTAVNPTTALTFATVVVGLVARGAVDGSVAVGAFALGVGMSSAAWQLVLAALGAWSGARVDERARGWLSAAGSAVVIVLAVLVVVG